MLGTYPTEVRRLASGFIASPGMEHRYFLTGLLVGQACSPWRRAPRHIIPAGLAYRLLKPGRSVTISVDRGGPYAAAPGETEAKRYHDAPSFTRMTCAGRGDMGACRARPEVCACNLDHFMLPSGWTCSGETRSACGDTVAWGGREDREVWKSEDCEMSQVAMDSN